MGLDPLPFDIEVKPGFEKRYRALLGDRYEQFLKYSTSYITKGVRVNTLKTSVAEVRERLSGWDLTPVPWCDTGFWIDDASGERYDWGNLPEHQMGYIYIQKPASMIPPVVLQPEPGEAVLDMCAAPGSKTTQIAAMMENTGVLVANDDNADRLKSLGINTQKCGVQNAVVTQMRGQQFPHRDIQFDKVLVDAPCSATGTIRTSKKAAEMWSENFVHRMRGVQQQLIKAGFDVLKPGGTMVYSTCSLEPEENEQVVSHLLDERDDAELQEIDLDIEESEPVTEFDGTRFRPEVKNCLRIYPQDNDTEGFFVAKVEKNH